MISPEEAFELLRTEGCSESVIQHVKAVSRVSTQIGRRIIENGYDLDLGLIEIGALLHDIGRCRTHDISHGVEGARILRKRGLERIAPFAENHLGAGITSEEAEKLDIPTKDYLPATLEEKIVTYGDNLIRGSEVQSFEDALEELREELGSGHPSLKRFKDIHLELQELGGVEE